MAPDTTGDECLAAFIAHELRTPLALQRARLELALADPLADAGRWRDVAEDVLEACLQQERLMAACLTLTRSRCGVLRREPVDVAAIAGEALRSHDLGELESVVALEPAGTLGDAVLVERMVVNLVSNAIRHNVPGGRIEVATSSRAGHAWLRVANSGPRIPASELGRLFQPFERLGSHARPSSGGSGLGLPLIASIARAHGAVLTAEAVSGGGLSVGVRFPALPPAQRSFGESA